MAGCLEWDDKKPLEDAATPSTPGGDDGGSRDSGLDAETGTGGNGSSPSDAGSTGGADGGGTGENSGGTGMDAGPETVCSEELCNGLDDDCDSTVDEQCADVDDCAVLPCKNGGVCADGDDDFTCRCAPGFEGKTCEVNLDDCAPNPCQNGGICADGANGFTCSCPKGYQGERCELRNDDCAPNPCRNGGVCESGPDGTTCKCLPGYGGTQCEKNIDECAPMPCQNGGVCTDGVNTYTCMCRAGFKGSRCETNIDECAPMPCRNGGTCKDGVNSYSCACLAGYSGPNCETNIDECASVPCQNGGVCRDGVNGRTCECPAATSGPSCEFRICSDLAIRSKADLAANRMCVEVRGNLIIAGTKTDYTSITSADFPYLTLVTGDLVVNESAGMSPSGGSLTSVAFGELMTVGGMLSLSNFATSFVSFPKLGSVGGRLSLNQLVGCERADFPRLRTMGAFSVVLMNELCSANFLSVTSVGSVGVLLAPKLAPEALQPILAASPETSVSNLGCCLGTAIGMNCDPGAYTPGSQECVCR
jgi:hypothetical protein